MIQFTKPKNLNGAELLDQLNAAGVEITDAPLIDENQDFWLNVKKADESKSAEIVAIHDGTMIAAEATMNEKLASVGLSVSDLKVALGL
jgi:hypothetical protein